MVNKTRYFYGWRIVGASLVILAIGLGMFTSTNSIFVKPVCDTLGFSRSQYTMHRTIMALVSAFILPLYGKYIKKFGTRSVLLSGAIVLSIIMFCYSFSSNIWHFYLLSFINGIFYNALSFMVIGILVSQWFEDNKGLAIGIAYSGSGLGGTIMIPVVSRVIELTDWRFAFKFIGIMGVMILIPVILLFIKDTPAKVGLIPYTSSKTSKINQNTAPGDQAKNETLKDILVSKKFWLLAIAFFLISAFASATNTHSAPYFSDIGYPLAIVSAVMSIFMLFMTIGKIGLGIIYDRFGAMAGNLCIAICAVTFPISALLSNIPIFPWVYAVSLGIASCGISVPVSILIIKYFDYNNYAMIFSIFTMIMAFGQSISVPVMGLVYDYTGSYRYAWIAFFVFSVIILASLISVEIMSKKIKADIQNNYGLAIRE